MRRCGARFFQKDIFICSFASTFLFGLIAHGYCYSNLYYSHDSLLVYQGSDVVTQISLGRFLVPLYLKVRGEFYVPWLAGLLSLFFLAAAAYLTVRLLSIERKPLICLVCGILATSVSLTLTNATYMKDVDIYMLSLLLSAAAAYICVRFRFGFAPSAVLLCLSLSLYQAFFQVAVFLLMVCVVRTILDQADVKAVLLSGVKALAALLLGLILYYAVLQIVLRVTGIPMADSYNGLSQVGRFGGLGELLRLIGETYQYTAARFLKPELPHSQWMALLNILLLLLSAALLACLAVFRKVRGWNLTFLAVDLLLMPFGINVIYFISQGVVHLLMIFSFFFVYAFAAMLLEMFERDVKDTNHPDKVRRILLKAPQYVISCILAVLIFNSIVYANQVYLKKDLEYQATMFTITRIVGRMEQTEGYMVGETPVVLVGTLMDSSLSQFRDGLRELSSGTGLTSNFSVTYHSTYHWYFDQILAYPINLLGQWEATQWAAREDVAQMAAFPAADACRMLDGVLVVKLS